jgi:hypothetical protein
MKQRDANTIAAHENNENQKKKENPTAAQQTISEIFCIPLIFPRLRSGDHWLAGLCLAAKIEQVESPAGKPWQVSDYQTPENCRFDLSNQQIGLDKFLAPVTRRKRRSGLIGS